MILKKIYNKLIHKRYKNFKKINMYYINFFGSKTAWINEVSKRLNKKEIEFDNKYSFSPHSPITNPYYVLDWHVDRMHAFLEYIDEKNVSSMLEIGCGFGLGTWILNDKFTDVTGLDISKNAIDTANKLFPEINYVQNDIENYFKENPDKKFDVILSCDGPPVDSKEILKYCKYFVRIGYRPSKISGALFNMTEKYVGLQLNYSTTIVSDDFRKNKISKKYFKYFVTPFYAKYFFDAFRKKYFPF